MQFNLKTLQIFISVIFISHISGLEQINIKPTWPYMSVMNLIHTIGMQINCNEKDIESHANTLVVISFDTLIS